MTKYDDVIRPDNGQKATCLYVVDKSNFAAWASRQSEATLAVLKGHKFDGSAGDIAIFPSEGGAGFAVAIGVANAAELGTWSLAKASENLPKGIYRLANAQAGEAMLGWILGHYSFDAYHTAPKITGKRVLLVSEAGRISGAALHAGATAMVRDLVNRPAADLGPKQLEDAARKIAKANSADVSVISGDALEIGYPMIYEVGKAAARGYAPRLIEIEWGDVRHPRIAIVGKGITFDSGGLDIKSSAGMRIMKKDMGGAAHALALADMIMKSRLPVRLHMLVAAAENCVSGNALRPGDIIKSRGGITVEIDNTDAEGRLVLADAMTKAAESKPELMIDFATLTGAARVALGPDLPALFVNDDTLAAAIMAAAKDTSDPVWRMPLWDGYDDMLASDIADTANSGGAFAGAVTAALFLKKFVPDDLPWAHLDTYAWRPASKPGRPKGGEALGLRAIFRYLADTYPVR